MDEIQCAPCASVVQHTREHADFSRTLLSAMDEHEQTKLVDLYYPGLQTVFDVAMSKADTFERPEYEILKTAIAHIERGQTEMFLVACSYIPGRSWPFSARTASRSITRTGARTGPGPLRLGRAILDAQPDPLAPGRPSRLR